MNVIVGPNNSGKSTIISSLRILEVALRKARTRKAEIVPLPHGESGYGYNIPEEQISVSLENIATDYNDSDSKIEFRISNRSKLLLFFPNQGGCILHVDAIGIAPHTPAKFRKAFPLTAQVVPVLGPLEHEENVVNEDTVKNSLNTHRASRHFRNYWRYFPDGWDEFSLMVNSTWPGMAISPPELLDQFDPKLTMFVSEDRIAREIYWAGFGFQVWCQLLTHVSRAERSNILVIDEPEIYLHPDVQRQLLGILRKIGTPALLATHSVEIMGEADPDEILLIDKKNRSATRLKDAEGIQLALEALGSAQNVTLAHLARTRKILFVEGFQDFKIIKRFAKIIECSDIASTNEVTPFESGGFSSWERVKAFSWGLSKTMESTISIAAIYDRDYFCPEFIEAMGNELSKELDMSHVHDCKEIENYLLSIPVLERLLEKQISNREQRTGKKIKRNIGIKEILNKITEAERSEIQSQYIAKRQTYLSKNGKDPATVTKETIAWFDDIWGDIDKRMTIVHGKRTIRILRDTVQQEYSVNMTNFQIIDSFSKEEVSKNLVSLINKLQEFQNN
jgi:energy-coupling factor transporter ATP-binding protein EcfA2